MEFKVINNEFIMYENDNKLGYINFNINNENIALLSNKYVSNEIYNDVLIKSFENYLFNKNVVKYIYEDKEFFIKKNYKYILLDLDDTLFDFKLSEKKAVASTLSKFNCPYDKDTLKKFSEINEEYFNRFAAGEMPRIEFQQTRFKLIFEYCGVSADFKEANIYFLNTLSTASDLFPDTIKFLDGLNEKKYKLFAATNGMESVQIERLKSTKIYDYFDGVYVSSKIGVNKPNVEFFNYIFNDLNDHDKSKYLIVGDRQESDMQGGINANIDTAYFNPNNKPSNIFYTYNLSSILELLNKI